MGSYRFFLSRRVKCIGCLILTKEPIGVVALKNNELVSTKLNLTTTLKSISRHINILPLILGVGFVHSETFTLGLLGDAVALPLVGNQLIEVVPARQAF